MEGGFILPEVGVEPTMETGEMPLAFDEEGILAQDSPAPSVQDELVEMPLAGTMISGDDVNSRLSEIFGTEPQSEAAERGDARRREYPCDPGDGGAFLGDFPGVGGVSGA